MVVDVGNTRIKWGRCVGNQVVETASLPPDPDPEWEAQYVRWSRGTPLAWLVSGVNPPKREALVAWLRQHGDTVRLLQEARELPLQVKLEHPDRVGIDRLLDAVAVNRRRTPLVPAVIIDAGSAVTVDWVDESGAFAGGTVAPGLRLMALALHQYTALLPVIEVHEPPAEVPGTTTRLAMHAGIFWSVVGGIRELVREMAQRSRVPPELYLGGGDGVRLLDTLNALPRPDGCPAYVAWPEMTLEGLRLTAESLA